MESAQISRNGFLGGGSQRRPGTYSSSDSGEEIQNGQMAPSVNGGGIEAMPRTSPNEDGIMRMGPISHRASGVMQANNQVWEDIANKLLPPEESELMLKHFEKRADVRVRRTYVEGVMMGEVDENAAVPRIGLTFLPGADKPQVTRLEQISMAGQQPEQRDAVWRVNTAASLLMHFSVSSDLSIVQSYHGNTTAVLASRVKSRLHRKNVGSSSNNSNTTLINMSTLSIQSLQSNQSRVTIDSDSVKIVNDVRREEWDLEATLIEVDGSSITKLMVNFRHLISRGGPEMTFEETRSLLEIMIEDARRLCVRSPVLFRMSTRDKIINSTNTRYGVNHGSMFRTLTTSQGIKEIISLSASYFNSLDPDGSIDSTQKVIRPRFLQMLVLLLSLLNNEDLREIADFLEATYKLKADRIHLELLFLKVIPLVSINSKVFLKAMIPAIEGFPLNQDYDNSSDHQDYCWDVFVRRILDQGYLLPGTVTDLGREDKSWIVKWPENGFKSTMVFHDLQYFGSNLRTVNEILPIEFHPEASLAEVRTIMTNGDEYTIGTSDLDRITCLTPGVYSVQEHGTHGQNIDLVVVEHHMNRDIYEAIRKINYIVKILNHLSTQRKGFNRVFSRRSNEIALLQECSGSGRLTKGIATLDRTTLAVAYKIEGRKTARKDAMRTMTHDIRELNLLLAQIERRSGDIAGDSRKIAYTILEEIRNHISLSEQGRQLIGSSVDFSDEPITKVFYPGGMDPESVTIWTDFRAWYRENDQRLHVEGLRSTVATVKWLSNISAEVTLEGRPTKYLVSSLQPVDQTTRDDEICEGDVAVLAGKYMIVAEPVEGLALAIGDITEFLMMNYMRVTSVEEQNSSRRRMNRTKPPSSKVLSLFR